MGNSKSTKESPHANIFAIIKPFLGDSLQPLSGGSATLSSLDLFNDKRLSPSIKSSMNHLTLHEHPKDMVSKRIVYGYAHEIESSLFQTNIPDEILNLILFNYEYKYPSHASFNDINYSQYLHIDHRSIISKTTDNGYGSCLFGSPITDKVCRKYTIQIKFRSLLKGFMMGYTNSLSGINYNQLIGKKK
eukprot:154348_1